MPDDSIANALATSGDALRLDKILAFVFLRLYAC